MVVAEHACDRCPNEKFCLGCYQIVHAPPVMQRHQQFSIGEKLQELAPCRTHPDEKLKYWCHRCNLLICRDCVLFEHKDHSYVLINDEAKGFEIKVSISCMW
jgi:tripartite motif-containing protein 56